MSQLIHFWMLETQHQARRVEWADEEMSASYVFQAES